MSFETALPRVDPVKAWSRIRVGAGGSYEFIPAARGEEDFRIVSDQGYESTSLTEEAARYWAARLTESRSWVDPDAQGHGERFRVQRRIVGETDWADLQEESDR